MERLDPRASKRVSGPSWAKVRPQFERINEALLAVSPETQGMLTTVYVKYAPDPHQQPFAVLWVRKSTELVLGLSLPEEFESPHLGESPVGCKYAGLTWYLTVLPEVLEPFFHPGLVFVYLRGEESGSNRGLLPPEDLTDPGWQNLPLWRDLGNLRDIGRTLFRA